jgi:predicted nucleic acid-binding protein
MMLVTGDAALRHAAEEEGVEVHGTLWLLDNLIVDGLLPSATGAFALERMQKHGSRFPQDECNDRLERWRAYGCTEAGA